ncbi:MAG: peptidyl-dipeptidase Dcp [Vicinamibacterales bacterium]
MFLVVAALSGAIPAAQQNQAPARANPLLTVSPLPFEAPPFDKIQDADFPPAFDQGIREQQADIDRITANPDPATFENTVVALEKAGRLLTRVNSAFNALSSANTDDTLQAIQEEEAPKLAAASDAIFLDGTLFERIAKVYAARDTLGLDPESMRLVEHDYQQFVLAGAKLSTADKATLKALHAEEAALSAKFVNQLLDATKAGGLVVADASKLAGLSPGELAAAAQAASARGLDGQWAIPLQNTTQQPALASLTDRDVRHDLFERSWLRAERHDANDTRATIARLAQIRAQASALLGFDSYAAWKLQDQMAGTPAAVESFLGKLGPAAAARARREAVDIQAAIEHRHQSFTLEPWDWNRYAEDVRKAQYDVDESAVKPYFELNRVLTDGVFYAAHQLYGLTFRERHDLPVYQPDVRVFEVIDADGSPLGLFYADYFKRDNKGGGAWMDNYVQQSTLLGTKPVICNVANFTKPAPGQPALLSMDDVTTMFHEFGHALHGFFAAQQYPSLSGTAVARDFVEFPSQFNEHWALDPDVLAHYAVHDRTGEPMPPALADKLRKARTFNAGYDMTELVAAADLDMAWHTLAKDAPLQDVDTFEQAALERAGVALPQVPPRYRSSYFMHIWGNGYAAGYYAYLWTAMLADDTFAWFDAHGGLTRENGDRFRKLVLSRGNTQDYGEMFRGFTGHDPDIAPMLAYRGLAPGGS